MIMIFNIDKENILRIEKSKLCMGMEDFIFMSAKIIKLGDTLEQNNIGRQIALQCAPLLAGIKLSNVLITECENEGMVKGLFENTSLLAKVIYQGKDRITFLIYQEEELIDYLMGRKERELMDFLGYEDRDINDILDEFSKRFAGYMEGIGSFPHEMGLLLEYPVEDVVGFMENQGNNFLYAGYWKVYGNLQKALDTFEQYNEAKERMVRLVSQGRSIPYILDARCSKDKRLAL